MATLYYMGATRTTGFTDANNWTASAPNVRQGSRSTNLVTLTSGTTSGLAIGMQVHTSSSNI